MMNQKLVWILWLILIVNGTVVQAAAADADSGSAMPRTIENEDYYRLQQELLNQQNHQEKSAVVDHTTQQETAAPDSTLAFPVTQIEIDASEILAPAEIGAITGQYEGRIVGIQELYQALREINELYAKKGFITAKAILPPQKISGGVVRIKLVEGHFGQFLLEGNKSTRSSYILERLSPQSGDLVNLNTLSQDIFYFNRTNDIQLKAELKPGREFGLTDCILRVEEPGNAQATFFSDNGGAVSTGEYRLGASLVINSLFRVRDSLTVSPVWTQGTWSGSLAYSRPLDKRGTRLGISYSKNQSSVISGAFQSLDIKSNETDIGLNLSHPLRVKPNFKADAYGGVTHKRAETDFSAATLIDYDVNALSLGVSFQTIAPNGFWYSRSDLTWGLPENGAAFGRLNLSAVRQRLLANDRLLIYRIAGQLSDGHLLPSTETFGIGGMTTVRGYPASQYSGDQGYNLSIEYNFPVSFSKKMKGIFFIDHGGVFPFKGNDDTRGDFLTSVGFGANLNFSNHLSGKVTIGFPIRPPDGQGVRIDYFMQLGI